MLILVNTYNTIFNEDIVLPEKKVNIRNYSKENNYKNKKVLNLVKQRTSSNPGVELLIVYSSEIKILKNRKRINSRT